MIRCGGRGRRAEFRLVGVYDTLQDGEDIDGIGVDSKSRRIGILTLHCGHTGKWISTVAAKFPEPPVCNETNSSGSIDLQPIQHFTTQLMML